MLLVPSEHVPYIAIWSNEYIVEIPLENLSESPIFIIYSKNVSTSQNGWKNTRIQTLTISWEREKNRTPKIQKQTKKKL